MQPSLRQGEGGLPPEHAGARSGLGLTSVGGTSIQDAAMPAAAHVPAAAGSIFGPAQLTIHLGG